MIGVVNLKEFAASGKSKECNCKDAKQNDMAFFHRNVFCERGYRFAKIKILSQKIAVSSHKNRMRFLVVSENEKSGVEVCCIKNRILRKLYKI